MATIANKGAQGAIFSNFYDAETAVMQQDPNSEGGYAVFGLKGEEGTGYTAGAESGKFFKGIAIRNNMDIVKHIGDAVSFVKKGKIWVKVSGTVEAGATAYCTSDGVISASSESGTAIGKFITNSTESDGLAVVDVDA